MKLILVLALVVVAAAAPQGQQAKSTQEDVQLIRYDTDNDGAGNWEFNYEQSDGHKHQQKGELRNAGTENEAIAVRGSYSWVAPDGVIYSVSYIADENGFQPTIEMGPGSGSIPPSVLKFLEA